MDQEITTSCCKTVKDKYLEYEKNNLNKEPLNF